MKILLTGGAGFIGSHTAVELIEKGYDVIIVDNFSNSKPEAVRRIEAVTGKTVKLWRADVTDAEAMSKIFEADTIDAVIHFAGLKAVPVLVFHINPPFGRRLSCRNRQYSQTVRPDGRHNRLNHSLAVLRGSVSHVLTI